MKSTIADDFDQRETVEIVNFATNMSQLFYILTFLTSVKTNF